ncbi:ABC transporter permease [Nonomuraea sp. B12E4]|uniref:ABC transporter permease n=1 Tax=Nonomuraea sp. B12E4 TaxID=3153564 RepID=UPI00325DCB3C
MRVVAAEFRKLLTLPSALVAIGFTVAAMPGLAAQTASQIAARLDAGGPEVVGTVSTLNVGFYLVPFAVIGPIVLGIVLAGSEYTRGNRDTDGGRQITASLTAVPARGTLLMAKASVLVVLSGVLAAVVVPATIWLTQTVLGEHGHTWDELAGTLGWRVAGAVAYWVLMSLLAFAVTLVARSGIVPMIFFVVNSSMVSFSFLLTRATPLAKYLPDVAGTQMFSPDYPAEGMLGPVPGGLVMLAWTAGLLAVAALVLTRRDA